MLMFFVKFQLMNPLHPEGEHDILNIFCQIVRHKLICADDFFRRTLLHTMKTNTIYPSVTSLKSSMRACTFHIVFTPSNQKEFRTAVRSSKEAKTDRESINVQSDQLCRLQTFR